MGTHAQQRGPSHRAGSRRWPTALAGVVAIVVFAAVLITVASWRDPRPVAAAGCPDRAVAVAVAPSIAEPVQEALRHSNCSTVRVTSTPSPRVAADLDRGEGPDYWVPESSAWATRPLTSVTTSVARSPLVVAGRREGRIPDSWRALLAAPQLALGDPLAEAAPALALALAQRDREPEAAIEALVPVAQRSADDPGATAPPADRLRAVARGDGITVGAEQQLLKTDMAMAAPGGRSAFLDYPLLAAEPDDEVAAWLAQRLSTTGARAGLVRAGFRTSGSSDVANPEQGVGHVDELEVSAAELRSARQSWGLLAAPTHGLAVVDVSGSMDFAAAGGTRMDLTVAAARGGLRLFPPSAEIGLWAFSEKLAGDRDHRTLVPVRPLGDWVGGEGTQLEALDAALRTLPDLTDGGTGLYDTTLAAYRQVLSEYRPGLAHTVLLLTDGANDDPGSIGLKELVGRLEELSAKAPVRIIAIGISPDADARALTAIAEATGGAAYVAEKPSDIRPVFLSALTARVKGRTS